MDFTIDELLNLNIFQPSLDMGSTPDNNFQGSFIEMDQLGIQDQNLQNEDAIYREMPSEYTANNIVHFTPSGPANQEMPSEYTASNSVHLTPSEPANQEMPSEYTANNNVHLTPSEPANQQMSTSHSGNIEFTVASAGLSKSDYKIDGDIVYIKEDKPLSICVSNLLSLYKLKFTLVCQNYKDESLRDFMNSDHKRCSLCEKNHHLKFCLRKNEKAFLERTEGNSKVIDMNEDLLLENGKFSFLVAFTCWNCCLKKGNQAKNLDFKIEILWGENVVQTKIYEINCYENVSRELKARKRKSDDVETDMEENPGYKLIITCSNSGGAEEIKAKARQVGATVEEA